MTADYNDIYARACKYANRKAKPSDSNFDVLWYASEFIKRCGLDHFGFEHASVDDADKEMEYLNQGETYAATIICEDEVCSVGSWGDWVTETEQEYCKAEGKIQCGACSEFVDATEDDWRRNECSNCDHYVDGSDIPEPGSQLDDCTEIHDGDYDRIWLDDNRIETHATKSRYTTIAVRVQYTEEYDSEWAATSGKYHVELLAVTPGIIGKKHLPSMLDTIGMGVDEFKALGMDAKCHVCIECDTYATLWQETGNNLDALLTAVNEERKIMHMMIGFRLDRPQNAIGSTGWDFMCGDILAGAKRKE
jgi:hypothetical protein